MWPPAFSIPTQASACHIVGFSLSFVSLRSIVFYVCLTPLWHQIISKNRKVHSEGEKIWCKGQGTLSINPQTNPVSSIQAFKLTTYLDWECRCSAKLSLKGWRQTYLCWSIGNFKSFLSEHSVIWLLIILISVPSSEFYWLNILISSVNIS